MSMNGMKYLVMQLEGSPTTERLYLFPEDEVHKAFADSIAMPGWKVVRGGFIRFYDGPSDSSVEDYVIQVGGEAFSLGLHSDKVKDKALLFQQIKIDL